MTTPFYARASVGINNSHGGGWRYPKSFPRLRWQLFIQRLERAQTWWAMRQCHKGMDRIMVGCIDRR